MSLISPKNFAAPFKNLVNLGLIIVIAVVFAMCRLSGGGVTLSNRKNLPKVIRETNTDKPVTQKEIVKPERATTNTLRSEDEDQISDLLRMDDESKGKKPSNLNKSNGNGSLDDIAKQLGVE